MLSASTHFIYSSFTFSFPSFVFVLVHVFVAVEWETMCSFECSLNLCGKIGVCGEMGGWGI